MGEETTSRYLVSQELIWTCGAIGIYAAICIAIGDPIK